MRKLELRDAAMLLRCLIYLVPKLSLQLPDAAILLSCLISLVLKPRLQLPDAAILDGHFLSRPFPSKEHDVRLLL